MARETSSESTFAHACLHHPILCDSFHVRTYGAAELVRAMGTPIKEFGIVVDGCLKLVEYTIKGQELCDGYFFQDDVFPEFMWYTGNKEYCYNLVTVKSATVAWINATTFALVVQEDHRLSNLRMEHLSQQALKSLTLLRCICHRTIRERVAFWILWTEKFSTDKRIVVPSQAIWANEMRVSRASLNQEIKRMEDQGCFIIEGHLLKILDRGSLEQLL